MAPLKGTHRRYYIPYEVASHNTPDDCWVSFLGEVYDITQVIQNHPGSLSQPLIQAAGTDISHWFDPKTRDVKKHICPKTNLERYYTPSGRFVHIPPTEPMGNWDTSFGIPWWKDKSYRIGKLSSKTRVIRVKNVLTDQEDKVEVPSEETLMEIRERYLELNWHARSYTWKALLPSTADATGEFKELDMSVTLEENGIKDEVAEFEDLQVATDYYAPVVHVYWNDDLTVA